MVGGFADLWIGRMIGCIVGWQAGGWVDGRSACQACSPHLCTQGMSKLQQIEEVREEIKRREKGGREQREDIMRRERSEVRSAK